MLARNIFLVSIIAIGLSSASENGTTRPSKLDVINNALLKADLNKLIDANIGSLQNALSSSDQIVLPDINKNIYITYYRFSNGQISKLSKIHRTDNSSAAYDNRTLIIDLNIGWKSVDIKYDIKRQRLVGSCKGTYNAQLTDLKAKALIDVDLKNYAVALKTFKFYGLGKINANVKSRAPCKLSSPVFNVLTKFLKSKLLETMQSEFIKEIRRAIESVNKIISSRRGKTVAFVEFAHYHGYFDEV